MKESGFGIGTVMFLIFMILKLCGIISWSWWWVTAPIWIPVGIILLAVFIMCIVCLFKSNN